MADIPEGIVMLQGRPHPTWPYVLNKMHQAGLLAIDSELIQIPGAENGNVAIVKATVILKGEPENLSFTAYGDASPANVKSNMIGAIIRLAETRAKGRAGRDSVNVGQALIEEMPDEETTTAAPPARPARPAVARHAPDVKTWTDSGAHPVVSAPPAEPAFCAVCGEEVDASMARAALKRFGQVLCHPHGRAQMAADRAAAEVAAVGAEE